MTGPGLRSGYIEGRAGAKGRGLGMILQRNGKRFGDGDLFERRQDGQIEEEADMERGVAVEAMGWDPEMGGFEGRRSGS